MKKSLISKSTITHILLIILIILLAGNMLLSIENISSAKSDYRENIILSKNLFDKDTAEYGVVVNENTGEIYRNDDYCVSNFIEVESGESYVETEGLYLAFYDKHKTFISGKGLSDTPNEARKFVVPTKGKYVRVSVSKENADYFQLEKGKQETEYQPYGYIDNREIYHIGEIPEIVLPKNIYATVGKEFDIYYKNIGLSGGGELCYRL